MRPFQHVDSAIRSFLACAQMERVGALSTAVANLSRNLGLSFLKNRLSILYLKIFVK